MEKSNLKSIIEKNKIAFSIILTSVLIVLAGITYSWYGWVSGENTPISFTMAGVSVVYTTGNQITGTLIPTYSHSERGNISKPINVRLSYGAAVLNLYLDVDVLPSELQDSTFLWELYKNDNTTPIRSGNFLFSTAGTTIKLLSNHAVTTSQDTYTLYLWIDGRLENPVTIGGKSFQFTLRATASDQQPNLDVSGANEPYLEEFLFVPVYYDEENTTWRKADVTNTDPDYKWYDYSHHQWANAVELKTIELDEQYENAPEGTAIPNTDISAFFVWIPRYKYKVWNINKQIGVDSYDAENTGIDIRFEEGEETTGNVTCNINSTTKIETCSGVNGSDYYTHPAFHVGERQLTGFWIPKFESASDDIYDLKYIPDESSISLHTLSDYFGGYYDPTFETPNYWPMTSLAWGAVAYLSNSEYGACSEVPIDGDEENTTRVCTPVAGENQIPTGTEGVYTTTMKTGDGDYLANKAESTTRNVYGVYDMNGIKGEYVMGIQYDSTNTGISTGTFDELGIVVKDKFFTPYPYGTTRNDQAAYTRSVLGDAIGETMKTSSTMWHGGQSVSFVNNSEDVILHTTLFSSNSSSQSGLCVNGTCTSTIPEKYGFSRYMIVETNKLF